MQPVRIIFFSDTHLGFDYPIRPRVKRRRRGAEFFDNYNRVLAHANLRRPDIMIHGGDFFFRSKVPAAIVDLAYAPLFDLADTGLPILIVPGNHERSELPSSLYLTHPNIHIFDRPRTFEFKVGDAVVSLSGFPFVRDVRRTFGSLVAETGWQACRADIRLMCIHQAICGASVGPANFQFRYGSDVVPSSDLPMDFHAVLSGHIHRHQILPGRVPVFFSGSTERTSFAEKDEDKGFMEFQLTSRRTGRPVIATQFHRLPTRPMINVNLDKAPIGGLNQYLRWTVNQLNPDAIIRLQSRTTRSDLQMLLQKLPGSVIPATMNYQLSRGLFRDPG